jgi:hypothetical protein
MCAKSASNPTGACHPPTQIAENLRKGTITSSKDASGSMPRTPAKGRPILRKPSQIPCIYGALKLAQQSHRLRAYPVSMQTGFCPFPPAQVCTSSAAGNINTAWHAQAEAARLSAPLQLESATWRGAPFHQSSGCSACALLERRRVASCAPPQKNVLISTQSHRPLRVLYRRAAHFFPYFQA